MKPTVTIDLGEYKALKEIEDATLQNKCGLYVYDIRQHHFGNNYGYAFVIGKDESLLLLQKEIDRLKALAQQRYETIEYMSKKDQKPKKKWWQL